MSCFQHQQIDLKGSDFRLVRLLRGDLDDEIECELIHASLDEDVIPYEAVSYTWGAPERLDCIKVHGQTLMVTSNLLRLLRDLREFDSDRYLWVDSISINQDDHLERGHQVQRMKTIYRKAERVILYLGPLTTEISILMDCLSNLSLIVAGRRWEPSDTRWQTAWDQIQSEIRSHIGDHSEDIQRQGLREILRRSWFRRVWILQEVANARTAWLYCGSVHVPVQVFALSPQLLRVDLDGHSAAVFRLLPTYARAASREARHGDLFSLLIEYYQAESYDPRDKIFALLGLCNDTGIQKSIVPDYSKDESSIVRDVILHIATDGLDPQPTWISSIPSMPILTFLAQLACPEGPKSPYMEHILARVLGTLPQEAVLRSVSIGMKSCIHLTPRLLEAAAMREDDSVSVVKLLMECSISVYPPITSEYAGPGKIVDWIPNYSDITIPPHNRNELHDVRHWFAEVSTAFVKQANLTPSDSGLDGNRRVNLRPDEEMDFLGMAMSFGSTETMQHFLKIIRWIPTTGKRSTTFNEIVALANERLAAKALYAAVLYSHAPTVRYLLPGTAVGDTYWDSESLACDMGDIDIIAIFHKDRPSQSDLEARLFGFTSRTQIYGPGLGGLVVPSSSSPDRTPKATMTSVYRS